MIGARASSINGIRLLIIELTLALHKQLKQSILLLRRKQAESDSRLLLLVRWWRHLLLWHLKVLLLLGLLHWWDLILLPAILLSVLWTGAILLLLLHLHVLFEVHQLDLGHELRLLLGVNVDIHFL